MKSLTVLLGLLLTLSFTLAQETGAETGGMMGEETIVDLAVADPDLSTLVEALTAADLVETLQGEGPFTVFAPNNAAFEALPPEELEALLADPDALSEVLLYHVVEGEIPSSDITESTTVTTVQGEELEVVVGDDGSIMVGGATVIMPDVLASNGVIHVIDAVLLPMGASEESGLQQYLTAAN